MAVVLQIQVIQAEHSVHCQENRQHIITDISLQNDYDSDSKSDPSSWNTRDKSFLIKRRKNNLQY
jgi:hypothetical protein